MIKLKELREATGNTQRDMAKIFNVSKSTYNYWENGKIEIDFNKLKEIAKYFDVSIDYLLGNSDFYYPDRLTPEERAEGMSKTKKESITPKEDDMLYYFRKIGRMYGSDAQDAAINVLKNMAEIKR